MEEKDNQVVDNLYDQLANAESLSDWEETERLKIYDILSDEDGIISERKQDGMQIGLLFLFIELGADFLLYRFIPRDLATVPALCLAAIVALLKAGKYALLVKFIKQYVRDLDALKSKRDADASKLWAEFNEQKQEMLKKMISSKQKNS